MSGRSFELPIDMRALIHVEMEMKGKSGMVKGMFIPYEANHMKEGKEYNDHKPMELKTSVRLNDEAESNGKAGFIKQKFPKRWAEMTDAEKEIDKKLPYLGNLFESSKGGSQPSGAASTKTFDGDGEDDLPF